MKRKTLLDYLNLFEEWDFECNESINPMELPINSKQIVSWRCKYGHRWKTQFNSRIIRNSSCPYCIGRRAISGVNDVATLYPKLKKQFHKTKNGDIKLENYKENSAKKIIWVCEKGHEWKATINTRTKRGYGCPVCSGQKIVAGINDFGTLYPQIASEVHPKQNEEIDLTTIGGQSHILLAWLCPKGHEYKMVLQKRTARGYGCPICAGRYAEKGKNDISTKMPELIKYWDVEKNSNIEKYKISSQVEVNWVCEEGHKWINKIRNQANCNECPFCSGKNLIIGVNDFASKYPQLALEWDKELNGIGAHEVKGTCSLRGYWRCDKGHVWNALLSNRLKGEICPYCMGKIPIRGINDLASVYPDIKLEWNFNRNKKSPNQYLPKSNLKVWWKCVKGHEWKARIADRTKGAGCPYCRYM